MISQTFPRSVSHIVRGLLDSSAARPLRFAGTGVAAGGLQLTLLATLTAHGWEVLGANFVAFLVAAQFNFVMSSILTWRDRQVTGSLLRRWILFHASIAVMAALNMLVFAVTRDLVPALAASALGIAAGACGNYLAGDRLIFRQPPPASMSSTPSSFIA
jgi:putative flippase GtrA